MVELPQLADYGEQITPVGSDYDSLKCISF